MIATNTGVNCFCVAQTCLSRCRAVSRACSRCAGEHQSQLYNFHPDSGFTVNPCKKPKTNVLDRLGPDALCDVYPCDRRAARSSGATARSRRRWSAPGTPWRRRAGRWTTTGRGSRRPPSPRSTSSAVAKAASEQDARARQTRHRSCKIPPPSENVDRRYAVTVIPCSSSSSNRLMVD